MNHSTASDPGLEILVLGWQSPPDNGRAHAGSGLTFSPFTTLFNIERYDTKLQNLPGQRKPINDLMHPIDLDIKTSPQVVFPGSMAPPEGVETILGAVDVIKDRYKTTFHFTGGESDEGYLDYFRQKPIQLRHAEALPPLT